jgi:hypothetical protein
VEGIGAAVEGLFVAEMAPRVAVEGVRGAVEGVRAVVEAPGDGRGGDFGAGARPKLAITGAPRMGLGEAGTKGPCREVCMEITERMVELSIARAASFFKTVARNPVVRGELLSRGLTDEELRRGWALYAAVLGFGPDGRQVAKAVPETGAARALNAIDAWDAPTFATVRVVLEAHYPEAARFLFADLAPSTGPAAVAGAERFLERVAMLRDGRAPGIAPSDGKKACELLAERRLLDATQEAELRQLIETAKSGAQPNELRVIEPDPARDEQARAFVTWLREWREVARVAIKRRDYQISLGLAQRRVKKSSGAEPIEASELEPGDEEG